MLCDSPKLLEEAGLWGVGIQTLLYTEGVELPPFDDHGTRVVQVTGRVMEAVSPMKTPQGVVFSCQSMRHDPPKTLEPGRYLVLDRVQDPGNVGTILRTADAFGADGLLLLPGCADLFNPKTVRASMGALFRLPVWRCTLAELRTLGERSGLPLLGSALGADAADVRRAGLERAVTLIGSEGRGLSGGALAICGGTVRIPMRERCESLNAAAAAAVLLWEGFR